MRKLVGMLMVLGLVASASAVDWNAGTGDWNVGANWVGGAVPSGTDAVVNNGGTAQISGNVPNTTATTIGNLGGPGNMTMSGGTFNAGNFHLGEGIGGAAGVLTKTGGDLNVGWMNVGHRSSGTLNHSGGAIGATSWFGVATQPNSSGTYNLSGTAFHSSNNIEVGPRAGSNGVMTMTGDSSASAFSVLLNHHSANNAARSEFNLDGGTLLTRDIRLEGSVADFNWGSGTLIYQQPNAGAGGGFALNGAGGEDPERGSTIRVLNLNAGTLDSQASLATGSSINEGNGGASTLDLRGFYLNGITRFDVLTLEGSLDLSADLDTLRFGSGDNFLRPFGSDARDWGSLTLVQAAQGITGQFDSFDFQGTILRPYNDPFPGSASALPVNTYKLQYTANELIFHYRIGGTVPEPSTMTMFLVGFVFIRGMRRKFIRVQR